MGLLALVCLGVLIASSDGPPLSTKNGQGEGRGYGQRQYILSGLDHDESCQDEDVEDDRDRGYPPSGSDVLVQMTDDTQMAPRSCSGPLGLLAGAAVDLDQAVIVDLNEIDIVTRVLPGSEGVQ